MSRCRDQHIAQIARQVQAVLYYSNNGWTQRSLDQKLKLRKSDQIIRQLITLDGKRKYLTQDERERFLAAAAKLDRGEVRTLCMTLTYTGCRISEALECDAARVDFLGQAITFRTLKQRDKVRYRSVPVPDELLSYDCLNAWYFGALPSIRDWNRSSVGNS